MSNAANHKLFNCYYYKMNKGKITMHEASAWGFTGYYGAHPDRETLTVNYILVPDGSTRSFKIPVSSVEGTVYRNGLWLKENNYKEAVLHFHRYQQILVRDTTEKLINQTIHMKTLTDELTRLNREEST